MSSKFTIVSSENGDSFLSLSGFLDNSDVPSLRQAVNRLKKNGLKDALNISMKDLTYLSDEVVVKLGEIADELSTNGDGVQLIDIPRDLQGYLSVKGLIPRIPSDVPGGEHLTKLREEYIVGRGRAVVVLEDNPEDYYLVAAPLLLRSYTVHHFDNGGQLRKMAPVADCCILSLDIVDMDGLDLLSFIASRIPQVMAVASGEVEMVFEQARLLGAKVCAGKPLETADVLAFVSGGPGSASGPIPQPVTPGSRKKNAGPKFDGHVRPEDVLAEINNTPEQCDIDSAIAAALQLTEDPSQLTEDLSRKKRVLVVDDSSFVRRQIDLFLDSDIYEIDSAKNGVEGMMLLEENRYDLILLDITMPIMDGLAALTAIKEEKKYANIPVIMITSANEKERVVAAFQRGATGYLLKPLERYSLERRLRNVFRA